jgi:DNA-binding response OmpR family regulator
MIDGTQRALILVADEDPHTKRLEQYFLEQAGFEVVLVSDGEEGLAYARSRRPHIIVTEILLPGMDGLSVCRALKTDAATRPIRVLVFSILAAETRAREAGADAFLRKPLDERKLIETVHSLLTKAGAA